MAVTSSGTATVTLPTDEQILITREFDAPKHLVHRAWTTPELVKRWWNAKRGEVTVARTTLTILVQHSSKEHRDVHIDSGMEAGMQDALDLLEQVAVSLR
jgi:uncharacterized protein YndB with AHSA1/START domain